MADTVLVDENGLHIKDNGKGIIQVQFLESINPTFITDKTNKALKELQAKGYEIVGTPMPFFSATYTEDKKSAKRIGCLITYSIPE